MVEHLHQLRNALAEKHTDRDLPPSVSKPDATTREQIINCKKESGFHSLAVSAHWKSESKGNHTGGFSVALRFLRTLAV